MKQFFSPIIFLPCLFALTSCGGVKNEEVSQSEKQQTLLDYEDVSDYHIFWQDIFKQELDNYLVYIYSKKCSHCNAVKEEVISYALYVKNVFFIEFCDDVVVSSDITKTIGASRIEDLSILGTPTLIAIEDYIVKENIAGESAVLAFINGSSSD